MGNKRRAVAALIAIGLLAGALATATAAEADAASRAPQPDGTEAGSGEAMAPDPTTAAIIDQVEQATLYQYGAWLTGVESATIGGEPYTITTRRTSSGTPIEKATQLAYEHMAGLGLEVTYQAWASGSYAGRNVIGEMAGLTDPGDILILSAHLDDTSDGSTAPGADDNASGSAAVLAAADVLSRYDSSCTIEFALWTGEEQGMLGSQAWASWARSLGLNVLGVLNLDMIGYDSDAEPAIDLHARSWLPGSVEIADLFAEVVDAYDLELAPEILIDDRSANYSDNRSFWEKGYDAILAIEDDADTTPHYHTRGDQLSTLNLPFLTEFVKASLGTLAQMDGCTILPRMGSLRGQVRAAEGSAPVANATITMADPYGAEFQATTGAGGTYSQTLPAGIYTVTAEAAAYPATVTSGVVVTAGEVTSQDLALEPLPCVLVVDDDDDAPDVRPFYTAALDELGYGYDLFETGGGAGPGPAGLEGYKIVVWFSGDRPGDTAGPDSRDEANLADYLDGGGRLFLSSQNYLDGRGLTSFGATYLGIGGYDPTAGKASALYGVAGDPIGQGLGPYALAYPEGFEAGGDGLYAAGGTSVAFRSGPAGGTALALDRDGGDWQSVFFGTWWVPLAGEGAASGEVVLQRAMEWFGDCACRPVRVAGTRVEAAGCTATLGADLAGTAPFGYEWDLGALGRRAAPAPTVDFGVQGSYPFTLTVSNCGGEGTERVAGTATVPCRWDRYLPAIGRLR